MKKDLDIKYNILCVKAFLNIFDLELEEFNNITKGDELPIKDNLGIVRFNEENIEIESNSKYGKLKAKVNYATATTLTDVESFNTIGCLGLYASFNNNILFELGDTFKGDMIIFAKIDNEFGNRIKPHIKLKYKKDDRIIEMKLQEDGFPFHLIEKNKNYEEKIAYSIFDTTIIFSYLSHYKTYEVIEEDIINKYCKYTIVSRGSIDKNKNSLVSGEKINGKRVNHNYLEFAKKGKDDEEIEIVNKGEIFTSSDSTVINKIKSLIEEFPFLEKIILYGFNNYSDKEIYSLFGIDKNGLCLEDYYLKDEQNKLLVKNILGIGSNNG